MFGPRTQPAQPLPPPPAAARPPNFFANGPSQPTGPLPPQLPSLPELSASPLKNIDAVKTYLEQSGGRPLNQVEIAGLVSMLQDSIEGADGTHAFLRRALCHGSNYPSHRFQMKLNSRSVFRKAHHVRVLRPSGHYFLPLPRLPSLLQQLPRKHQPRRCPRIQTERTSGKVLEVHAAIGTTRPHSDHLALGPRSSFRPRMRQRATQRGDASARTLRLHPHRRRLPVVSRPLNQPIPVPLPVHQM